MIHSRLSTMDSIKNSRVQGAPLAVLQGAHMPAILIEVDAVMVAVLAAAGLDMALMDVLAGGTLAMSRASTLLCEDLIFAWDALA